MPSENGLSSCAQGTGYKEERMGSTKKRKWAPHFLKIFLEFFSLKDTNNVLGHLGFDLTLQAAVTCFNSLVSDVV